MSRKTSFAAALVLGLMASACSPHTNGLEPANNPSLYSVHQPVVERTDYVLDLTTSGDRLPETELARLDHWFSSIELGYGDRVSIDEPQGYGAFGAREDVARVAGRYGLLLTEGAPITAGQVQPGSVRVIASRAVASVSGCPNWSRTDVAATTTTSTNFGCAVNSNLSAMIADPNDLVLGRTGTGRGNAATATRAIRTYRERPPSSNQGLQNTRTSGGGSQ